MKGTGYTQWELRHYGVPGMKWGRRKARPVVSGNGNQRPAQASPAQKQAAKNKTARGQTKAGSVLKKIGKGTLIGLGVGAGAAAVALGAKFASKSNRQMFKNGFDMVNKANAGLGEGSGSYRKLLAGNVKRIARSTRGGMRNMMYKGGRML